jgi:hypothetical protein
MEQQTSVHPLAATLARVMADVEYLQAQHGVPTAAGWFCPAADYTAGSEALQAQIAKTQADLRTTTPIVVAGSLLQHVQWPLLTVAVRCYLHEGRVPAIRPNELWLHLKQDSEHQNELDAVALAGNHFYALPDDPDAAHPDATLVADRAALRERLREMVRAHFAPAVALLCAELGCKERPLWLFVADGLGSTVAWTQLEQEPPVSRSNMEVELDGLVRVQGTPLFARQIGLFELTFREQPRLQYDRATCCYWYKTEDAKGDCCTTCPRRPKAERDALLLIYLEEQEAERLSV